MYVASVKSVVGVIDQLPLTTVPEAISVEPSNNFTTSPLVPVPVNVGRRREVIRSDDDVPLSLDAASDKVGAAGNDVLSVMVIEAEAVP